MKYPPNYCNTLAKIISAVGVVPLELVVNRAVLEVVVEWTSAVSFVLCGKAAPFESAWSKDLAIGVDLILRRQYLGIVLPRFHSSPIR